MHVRTLANTPQYTVRILHSLLRRPALDLKEGGEKEKGIRKEAREKRRRRKRDKDGGREGGSGSH